MVCKAAVTGVNLGARWSVILAGPHNGKSNSLFRASGFHLETLGDIYIGAEDVCVIAGDLT